MKALISIDYTYDFVATDGKLTTGQAGQEIEAALVAVTKEFIEQQDFVVFAIDGHDPNDQYHPENRLFPPHNLLGTEGRALYGQLAPLYQANQDKENVYWLDKRHYSAFCGTDLDLRLRERKITQLYLTGVCTDICVLHTAVDAYNLGYEVFIVKDAVASFDPVGHQWALQHFKNTLGATMV
ncbi:cysteine hydrolase family protein [Enterococcus columbae]|uniref:Isochorismatase n=1 Tax=Enterococcus columbae DSM 7374 = ATCC 51263 TaxID=1121865 RepID=S1NSR2_9ENTE|nr:isochorismatase family cysteine hydrolase [Enterococcus columbae]EOT39909.1 isochorismatase [Enterococcus columbae DSM 7374 = ATCC 51263]EOW83894.1 isochorismatase [Enterococcus columbae DSM 7374 = ATCC 51263]OJG20548.1 isochorismatase [Enterococcus columbae DSM 7374 = ATCC 51263]